MFVYRIVQKAARTKDLSGTGAFRTGGRWNSKRTYMIYTSENSSLAYLELLVHFDKEDIPPNLFIIKIEISDSSPVYQLPESDYPTDWFKLELTENKKLGDKLMQGRNYVAIKVRSAINQNEYNYLLNPLYPKFSRLVKIIEITPIKLDERLV